MITQSEDCNKYNGLRSRGFVLSDQWDPCNSKYIHPFLFTSRVPFTYPFPSFYVLNEDYLIINPFSDIYQLIEDLKKFNSDYNTYIETYDGTGNPNQVIQRFGELKERLEKFKDWKTMPEFNYCDLLKILKENELIITPSKEIEQVLKKYEDFKESDNASAFEYHRNFLRN